MTTTILVVSGAVWGATSGNQRYQRLAEELQKIDPRLSVKFFHYLTGSAPLDFRWLGEPPQAVIVGYPSFGKFIYNQIGAHTLYIYDVCDYWLGNELIAGVDLVADDGFMSDLAQILVGVNHWVLIPYLHLRKPMFVIGNGITDELLQWDIYRFPRTDTLNVYFWGSHFVGQTWLDIECLAELPRLFPQLQFYYFFATDYDLDTLFPKLPNLHVEGSPSGVPFIRIKEFIRYPAIGLVPFKPWNTAAFYADPIKIYEYYALGFAVLAVNVWCGLGEQPCVYYLQGIPVVEIGNFLEEVMKGKIRLEFVPPSRELCQRFSWQNRAYQYYRLLQRFLPFLATLTITKVS